MITVRVPASLQVGTAETFVLSEPLATIADLISALDRRIPGFRDQLEDGLFNFAVNDTLLLRGVRQHPLADGDRVELVPTISGG